MTKKKRFFKGKIFRFFIVSETIRQEKKANSPPKIFFQIYWHIFDKKDSKNTTTDTIYTKNIVYKEVID